MTNCQVFRTINHLKSFNINKLIISQSFSSAMCDEQRPTLDWCRYILDYDLIMFFENSSSLRDHLSTNKQKIRCTRKTPIVLFFIILFSENKQQGFSSCVSSSTHSKSNKFFNEFQSNSYVRRVIVIFIYISCTLQILLLNKDENKTSSILCSYRNMRVWNYDFRLHFSVFNSDANDAHRIKKSK